MRLAEYYFADPRLILVPIEHLTPAGMGAEFAALLAERCGWDAARIAFFNTAFALYWERSAALAWLRQLYHENLRPAPSGVAVRSIAGSRLLVPRALEDCPPVLVQQCTAAAHNAAAAFFSAWRASDRGAVTSLLDWLAGSTP